MAHFKYPYLGSEKVTETNFYKLNKFLLNFDLMFVQIVTQAFNCFLIVLNIYKNIGFVSKYHVKAQNI